MLLNRSQSALSNKPDSVRLSAIPGECQCGMRRLAVANGPNIFQMLLVRNAVRPRLYAAEISQLCFCSYVISSHTGTGSEISIQRRSETSADVVIRSSVNHINFLVAPLACCEARLK